MRIHEYRMNLKTKLGVIHCLIMSLILVTTLFNRVLRLQGEIWCW